jgi:hypothetical protein
MRALSTLAALAGAGLLLWGVPGSGYVVAWPALATAKRDVRVYNNFGDVQANDDTTPDARWPGWTGAPRAIWKGAAEWGSRLHGTGGGDPTQPNGIGSGGANLDPLFLGLAPGVGAPNDDVVSELNGSGGAVMAFTELPPNDGWRVRFYANPWILDDDTNGPVPGAVDIQGIFTHEYGHCLGLDHSSVPGCTMEAVPPSTLDIRSIEQDDIAGVQAIYGAAVPGKPELRALTLSGGVLTLLGSSFGSAVDIEFLGASALATPASAGGTLVQLGLRRAPDAEQRTRRRGRRLECLPARSRGLPAARDLRPGQAELAGLPAFDRVQRQPERERRLGLPDQRGQRAQPQARTAGLLAPGRGGLLPGRDALGGRIDQAHARPELRRQPDGQQLHGHAEPGFQRAHRQRCRSFARRGLGRLRAVRLPRSAGQLRLGTERRARVHDLPLSFRRSATSGRLPAALDSPADSSWGRRARA